MRVNRVGQKIKEVPLILLGMGKVGGALLQQLLSTREALQRETDIRFTIIGLADSTGALLDRGGLTDFLLTEAQRAKATGRSFSRWNGALPLREIDSHLQPGTLLIDATASAKTVSLLKEALAARCGIVLANKLPLAGPWVEAEPLFAHPFLRYEATVGAGLPIISTLRTLLLATGDRITSIEGVLSGTLAYLCTQLMRGTPYSVALAQARALGYTEPDPREDLSGQDVVRKALILARTAGWPIDEGNITVEPLYPPDFASLSVDGFLSAASTLDEDYAHRVEEARSRGRVLCYVARVGPNGGAVGVEEVEKESALGALRGPENAVSFHTERYAAYPLVVSGPGAGPQVTAAGVLGDIIELAKQIDRKEELG